MKKKFSSLKNVSLIFFLFFSTVVKSQIDFSASIKTGCSPLLVEFTEIHTKQNIVKRFWNFGNSATSIFRNPSTIYTSSGKYTVTLITEDSNGVFDTLTYTNMIEVFDNPVALFETNTTNYCVNDTVNIVDKSSASSGAIRNYLWDFGDGKTYSIKEPKHVYASPGSYTVTLLVTDFNGCNSTFRRTFFYNIGNLPTIDFTSDKTVNCGKPLNVKFSSSNSQIIKSYFWEFGDGKTSTVSSPTHNYDTVGKFNVKLTVVDSNGCKNTITKQNIIENLELKASFENFSTRICDNESISFKNLSTPKRSDIRYRWEFGDGTFSTQFEPTKKYTQSGNYTIKLFTFIPNTQCSDSFIVNVKIDIIKTQDIKPIISDTLFCQLPKIVFFQPSDTVSSALWRFTNSPFDTSSKIKPSFLFTRTGNFNIVYEFKDTNGCIIKGTKTGGVRVTSQTVSIGGIFGGCVPRTETFRVQTANSSNIVSYSWYLDDVLVATSSTYTHNFKAPSAGKIRVVVKTKEDCEYSATSNYNYGGKTGPDFFPVNTEMCFSQSIKFIIVPDTTKPPITSFEWIFENQKKTTGEHKFSEFKDQKVTLITRNGTCADTTVKFFDINGGNNSIKGPVSIVGIRYDTCNRTLRIDNKSLSYTFHRWNIGWSGNSKYTKSNDNNSFIFELDDSSQNFDIKLTTFNDSNNCPEDTILIKFKTTTKLFTSFDFKGNFCAPSEVQFTNTSNYSSIDTFRWFVNNSQVQKSEDDESVISSSVNIDYVKGQTGNFNPLFKFGNSGEYEIVLIGQRFGCIDTIRKLIKIAGPEINPIVIKNNDCLPLNLSLIDSNYRDGKKSMWVILNVDTILPNSQSTSYLLEKTTDTGIVKIKYIEWDENDCVTWKIINLPVNGPFVNFSEKLITTCDSAFIEFIPEIKNVNVSTKLFYLWELGDGKILNSNSKFIYRYNENKSYNVKLTVIDDKNCFSNYEKKVEYFEELLKADFIADTSGLFCPPVKISLKNSSNSSSPIVKYFWEFGDGTVSSEENPEKVFIFPGVFSVKLTVENSLGCIDSVKLPDFIIVNGPIADFSFDKEFGCVPLEVNFKLITNNPTNRVIWDMGDGRVLSDTSFTHVYNRPGNFYPMLIVKDTFGCEYIVPRDRKIQVYPLPIADFLISDFCYDDTVYFKNISLIDSNQTNNFFWYSNDSFISSDLDAKIFLNKFEEKNISLIIESNIGCNDSIFKSFKVKDFNPEVNISNSYICLGESIKIISKVNNDQIITEYRWSISDGTVHFGKTIEYTPKKSGEYNLELYLKNTEGCDTTLYIENFLKVKDTLPDKNPEILSVSVLDNSSVEIKHRSSEEISFKSYQVYRRLPNDQLKLVRSTNNINDTFLIETGLNTLHNVYCYIVTETNSCEYESFINDSFFHCTIDVKGFPDTNSSILSWNAYYGWEKVKKYEIYKKKEIQSPFAKIGEVPGDSLSFIDSSTSCRSGFFYRILAYDENSDEISWSDTCKVTPIYFNQISPPKFELSSILDNKKVELYWSKPGNSRNSIIYYVIDRSEAKDNFYKNITKLDSRVDFYIDSKVDVNNLNYFYKIKAVDECDDESEYSELTSPILLKVKLNDNYRPFLFWTPYRKWEEGVAYYEIEQLIDGVFMNIGRTESGEDTNFTHHNFIQNCFYPYIYRVIAVKDITDSDKFTRSLSNEATLKAKPTIFAPNAFSPNNDKLNDIYEIKGLFIKSIVMQIYNRWGEKLYETPECLPTWDGYYMEEMVPDGVYLVLVRAIGVDDNVYTIRTTLTVIK